MNVLFVGIKLETLICSSSMLEIQGGSAVLISGGRDFCYRMCIPENEKCHKILVDKSMMINILYCIF